MDKPKREQLKPVTKPNCCVKSLRWSTWGQREARQWSSLRDSTNWKKEVAIVSALEIWHLFFTQLKVQFQHYNLLKNCGWIVFNWGTRGREAAEISKEFESAADSRMFDLKLSLGDTIPGKAFDFGELSFILLCNICSELVGAVLRKVPAEIQTKIG